MDNIKFQNLVHLLKKVKPDASFFLRSKIEVISSPQETKVLSFPTHLFEKITTRTAVSFASIFLVVVAVGISYLTSVSNQLGGSLDNQVLVKEAVQAELEIQIAEAVYFDRSAEKVALALDKIAGIDTNIDLDEKDE